jgi:hypothetical protein
VIGPGIEIDLFRPAIAGGQRARFPQGVEIGNIDAALLQSPLRFIGKVD